MELNKTLHLAQNSQTCAATSTQVVVPGTAEMLPKVLLMLLNMFLALQWR